MSDKRKDDEFYGKDPVIVVKESEVTHGKRPATGNSGLQPGEWYEGIENDEKYGPATGISDPRK